MPPPPPLEGFDYYNESQEHSKTPFQELKSFAVEVSVVGARSIVTRRTWFQKVLWIVLVICSLAFAIYQIQDRFVHYFEYKTTTSLEEQNNDMLDFPQITFCNENQILLGAAKQSGLYDVLQAMNPLYRLPGMPAPNFTVFDSWNWTDETILSLSQSLAQPFPSGYTVCLFNGVPCSMISAQLLKPLVTDMGQCFTFNYAGVNLTTSNAGSLHGLTIFLNVQQFDYFSTGGSITAGFRVLIHEQKEVPLVRELGIKVSPGVCTYVALSYSRNEKAKAPYGTCKDEDDYTELGCRLQCVTDYLVTRCGCRYMHMPGTAPLCSIVQIYLCAEATVNNYTIDTKGSATCHCAPQCVTIKYGYSLSSATYSDHSLQLIKATFPQLSNLTTDQLSANMACLEVFFSTLESLTMRADPAYTWSELLAEIGGALGLFLGATLLTIVECVEFIVRVIRVLLSSRKNNQKRNLPDDRATGGVATPSNGTSSISDDIKL